MDRAEMSHPGTFSQDTLIQISLEAVEGCDNRQRLIKVRTQLKRNGHWIVTSAAIWLPIGNGGALSNQAQKEVGVGLSPHSSEDLDRCVNGRREPVRVQFKNEIRNTRTGKVVKRSKIKNYRIEVVGGCSS
ncbi:MAG: hypothetical protein ACREMY_22940 [bacterium]